MEEKTGKAQVEGDVVKRAWPTLATAFQSPFTWVDTWLMVNILIVSQIIWPGEPLHVSEMGVMAGTAILSEGIFALAFGILADKYSRKKIMTAATILHGGLFALQGLMPAGYGNLSFFLFLGVNMARSAVFGYRLPLEISYTDDRIAETSRSRYFGISMLLERLGYIVGGIIAASTFTQWWRIYFFVVGFTMVATGILIGAKAVEPKRGSMRKELRSILNMEHASYNYRLNKETLRSTLFSRTNVIAMGEGIFTNFTISFPLLLFFACFESAPFNIAPIVLTLITVAFGTPGAIFGAIGLASICDRWGKKTIKARIYMIIASLLAGYCFFIFIFFIPVELDSDWERTDFILFHVHPVNWLIGAMMFGIQAVIGLFYINQSPFLQAINLPEAQGAVSSLNKFLELLGRSIGLLLSGITLEWLNDNYQHTVSLMMVVGFIGVFLWGLTLKWVDKDRALIARILRGRSGEMEEKKE
ncbi:MAG: MFS transporter [Candidatus Lokiarchaeota archaeon]|nr:MFS transporter [Candidatus Lokiarchaeota archaeon]